MTIFAIVLAIIVAAVLAVLAMAATKPNSFVVQRTIDTTAAPETVFALISDFHRWRDWSPYEGKDPQMSRTYSGAEEGQGAVYEWNGNKNVGHGRMEISDASKPHLVVIKLDFMKPFEAHNIARFTIEPMAQANRVTWAMSGPSPYMSKLMQVFMNFDTMIGTDFEKGLANLKALAERQALGAVRPVASTPER